jgi:hypothetical protein
MDEKTTHQRRQCSRTLRLCAAIVMMAAGKHSVTPALADVPGASQAEGSAGARCTPDSRLRYCDNGDGTVRDNRSGLLWLKDANCVALGSAGDGGGTFEEANAAAANLGDGQCGLSDGSRAGDWRLPNKQEWQAMLDRSFKNPALGNADGTRPWKPGDVFIRVRSGGYWSSATDSEAADFAWSAGIFAAPEGYWLSTAYSEDSAWNADLFSGAVASARKDIHGFIWPVRNP